RAQTSDRDLLADSLMADGIVLAIEAAQIAAGEENGAGAALTREAGLFPWMPKRFGDAHRGAAATVSTRRVPIHTALAGAQRTTAQLRSEFGREFDGTG
ncbi:MAG: hypothetical protein ACP5R2_15585, partial [Anaerolineae bacterium]